MKNGIVITGASSGFGALTARALAKAGHIVYASMRETKTATHHRSKNWKSTRLSILWTCVPSN